MTSRIAAFCAIVLLSPLLLTLILLQKATSRGPVLFQSEMLGMLGCTFWIKKFRSMKAGSEQILSNDDKTVVLQNDPRLTLIGPYLRIGFDELPQLLNILAGEMAFVGPRPDPSWVLPRYTSSISDRLMVRPGITGLSQVLDGRNQRQAVIYYLDVYYIRHQSWLLDIAIIALTMPYVIGWRTPGRMLLEKILDQAKDEICHYELMPPSEKSRTL